MKRVFAALMALVAPAVAHASCDVASQYTFAFANQPAATLNYGSTYAYTAVSSAGASLPFSVAIAQNGLSSTAIANTQMPAIGTLITGPDATKRDLVFGGIFAGRTTDLTSGTRVITVTFTFSTPIRDFSVVTHDIDFTLNQYRDWIMITGASGATTYTPVLTTPWGNGNGATAPRTATGSALTSGATTAPVTLAATQAAGTGASNNNSDDGTITATFAQPVTTVVLRYGNYPFQSGETTTGQQGAGIASISACPMPSLSVTKASAPRSGNLGAYNLPGTDVVYVFSVSNTGNSPVDPGTIILTDIFPAGITYLNTNFDGTTALPVKLVSGTSGVTLAAANISYSNDKGVTWSYAPSNGYDPLVNAIRITPSGNMAANSNFTLSFAASIK
ncbi:hypothetical protein GCM10008023_17250 [Sphingomonas glacialis]|uniref:DUF11 domain-containing protein n=1 Tax=Sphingomonas glacialis TaxID=658225 RepID=A0ABQ3LFW8_9SPHN|nr:hypothetical protein [Sphingomonas glacialis]GHH14972.1 hypothetical protein GCM10008023_17250 [Sphingomonas glacialis]